jgi:RNA polymerase sigma-70 factor (ECF subfamily)
MNGEPEQPHEEAFRRVLACRTMLKVYVQAIVREPSLAEDTFSDVTLEIARAWANYDKERPFENWARGVARRVALANLRKQKRQPVQFDEEVLESIGHELDTFGNEVHLQSRKEILERCLERLSEKNRQLIKLRYFENRSYEDISVAVGRTIGALYVVFNRIHQALARCVEKGLRSL